MLYIKRFNAKVEYEKQKEESEWNRTRIIWTTLMNANRDPKKKPNPFLPTDLIRLSFDEDDKPVEIREPDLEAMKKKYAVNGK